MAGSPDRLIYQPALSPLQKEGKDNDNLLYLPPIPNELAINADEGRWREEDILEASQEVYHFQRYGRGREAQKALKEKRFENEEHKAELEKYVREGMESRDEIAGRNSRLVRSIAKRRIGQGLAGDDLQQEGNLGLLTAIDRFDWTRGYKFSTYATWWIRQAVNRAISDQSRTIRIPEHALSLLRRLGQANKSLEQKFGREPTIEELALAVDSTPDKIQEVYRLTQSPVSLEMPITEDGGTLVDVIAEKQEGTEEVAALAYRDKAINTALAELSERERVVLELRFGLKDKEPKTLEEVGRLLGVTRERIRQIEAKALRKLRHPSRGNKLRDYLE